jgi:integrase
MRSAQDLPRSVKLTTATVRALALPEGKKDHTFFDVSLPGFGVRLRESGASRWVFQYKFGSQHRRMVLGSTGELSVGDARKTAELLKARVRLGQDPAADKAEARIAAAETFGAALPAYLGHQRAVLRPRSYPDVERHLLSHAKLLHPMQLAKIERRDIATVLARVGENSGLVTSNRVRTSLSGFFSWAMTQGLVDGNNPVIGTLKHEEQSRERVLAPHELRAIWQALGDDDYGDIVRLLALTGQRASEIAGLCWSEIQGDMIVLPGDRTKNHRPHTIPLSHPALAIIGRHQCGEDRDPVFGRGFRSFSGWSSCKVKVEARIAATGAALPHWTPHDLRRTFATYAGGGLPAHLIERLPAREKEMARGLGIAPHVIEAVLNHVSSGHKAGVAGVYNRSDYSREKRQALDIWAEHLMAIIADRPATVTPLRREA